MSHVDTSPLSHYNSLSDPHLAGYFANTKMRHHLRRSGLITRRGEIVSHNSYRLNMARKEHKKHVKDLLAHAIVSKTLDLERHRQVAIRHKLEEIAKIELVQRVKNDRKQNPFDESLLPLITPRKGKASLDKGGQADRWTPADISGAQPEEDILLEEVTHRQRRNDEDLLPYLSPRSSRPQSGPSPRSHRSNRSSKYRPISAPSNMPDTNSSVYESNDEDADTTYVDDDGNPVAWSEVDQPSGSRGRNRTPRSREEIDARHLYSLNPAALRRYATTLARMEQTNSLLSPYLIPQVPIPPSSPRTAPARGHRGYRGRSSSSDKSPKRSPGHDLHRKEPPMSHQGDIHSMCEVTMKYHGWALNLAREQMDPRQEVLVEQQHCGGNTLTVFRDLLVPGSTFTFTSKRHRGYPFSLTLYVDGRQDARVSTCCEMGHSKKVRLGGKQGHFSIVNIGKMSPCYKCQVQKGLKGGKAPLRRLKRPAKNEGEEVIVMETTPREKPTQKSGDAPPAEAESDSAGEQILVPVEPEGTDPGGADAADDYEDDFDDEEGSEKEKEKEEPDEDDSSNVEVSGIRDDVVSPYLTGGAATTARTDVEVEGQEAEESGQTDRNHQNRDTSYKFYTETKTEVTAVEENVHDDSESESMGSNSDSLKRMKEKYASKSSDGESKSFSSSNSADENKKKQKSKTASYSTDTFQAESEVDPSGPKEVNAAEADTADDVSDIETDVEWPRKSDEDLAAKELVIDTLPPKPQKPQVLQGILSPKKEKRSIQKKKTTFQIDEKEDEGGNLSADADMCQESSVILTSDDGLQRDPQTPGKKKYKKKKRCNKQEKLSPKNYNVGLVACNPDDRESDGPEHLTADVSDRTKEDLSSDIPEISIKRSGVTLFSDRVETEPCREHVTVGKSAEEEEEKAEKDEMGKEKGEEEGEDERGTESDENTVEAESSKPDPRGKFSASESEVEAPEDVVAKYAAHLTELDDRALTKTGGEELEHKEGTQVPETDSSQGTQDGSRVDLPEDQTESRRDDMNVRTQEDVKEVDTLPTIVINNTDVCTVETDTCSLNRMPSAGEQGQGHSVVISEGDNVEVTLADIKSNQLGNVSRRVSTGGESLLSVPCSDVDENGLTLWAGEPKPVPEAPDEEVISPMKSSQPSSDVENDADVKQKIPVILVNEGAQEQTQELAQHDEGGEQDNKSDTNTNDSDTDSESSSSSSSSSGSDSGTAKHEDTTPKSGAHLAREDSSTVPTIITEHVD